MEKYPVKTYPVDRKKIKALAPRYPRYIRWSDEDKCFIGSLPDLCGDCCHGDTPEEVARELNISAELALEAKAKFGFPFPEPRSVIVTPSEYRETGTQGRIKALRKRLGLSQADFAASLGVARNTVSLWEQGRRKPDGAAAKLLQIVERTPEAVLS